MLFITIQSSSWRAIQAVLFSALEDINNRFCASSKLISVRFTQSANALSPMLSIVEASTTEVRFTQPRNIFSPNIVTPSGITTFLMYVLPLNAPSAIFLIKDGISTIDALPLYLISISFIITKSPK